MSDQAVETQSYVFADLPSHQLVTVDWFTEYAPLAREARQSLKRFKEPYRQILGLCRELELQRDQAGKADELAKKVKQLQMENGKLKKRLAQ